MKKIISLLLAATMLIGLVSCRAQVENGGKPTPDKLTSGAYEAEPEEVILYKIDAKEADPLLAELSGIIKKMSNKVLESDMLYFKKVVAYLAQYNDYEGDLAQYMHTVEQLLDSFYDMYVLNCNATEVKAQIDSYFNDYYKLSDEFKNQYASFEAADLYAIMSHVETMVDEMLNPSEEPSSTTSSAVSSETASTSPTIQ